MSFVTGKYQDSLILNDMSIQVLKEKDPGNILKFKILSQLGATLNFMNQTDYMRDMFKSVLEQSNKIDHYIKVHVLRTYGYTLYRHEKFRKEGEDYIE